MSVNQSAIVIYLKTICIKYNLYPVYLEAGNLQVRSIMLGKPSEQEGLGTGVMGDQGVIVKIMKEG